MKSANYIGRIGALAVTLGIGTAVLHSGAGLALADTGGSTGTSSTSSSSSATSDTSSKTTSDNTTDESTEKSPAASSGADPTSTTTAGTGTASPSNADAAAGARTRDVAPGIRKRAAARAAAAAAQAADSKPGAETSNGTPASGVGATPPAEGTGTTPPAAGTGATTPDPVTPVVGDPVGTPDVAAPPVRRTDPPRHLGADGRKSDASTSNTATSPVAAGTAEVDRSPVSRPSAATGAETSAASSAAAAGSPAAAPAAGVAATTIASATTGTVSGAAPAVEVAIPAAQTPRSAQTLTGIVNRVLTGVAASLGFGQAASHGPTPAPVETPGVWALMAFARRQIGLDTTEQNLSATTALAASTVTTQAAAANQPPTLNPQQSGYVVDHGLVYTIGTLNGADPEGAPLTYSVPSTGTGSPQHGVVFVDAANNFWAHVATRGYTGTDTFTVAVSDGVTTVTKQVTVTVPPATSTPNSAPVVNPTTPYAVDPAQPGDYAGMVRGHVNVSDPNLDVLTYTGTGNTPRGYVQIDPRTGSFAYIPTAAAAHAAAALDAGTTGANRDTFTVTVNDGRGGTVTVPVTVSITGVNTAPFSYATPTVNAPNANGVVTGKLNVFDNEGDALTYTVTGAPGKGRVVIASDGTFAYAPSLAARMQAAATPGADVDGFTVTVTDGHGGTTTITVGQVTVAPATPAVTQNVTVGDFPLDVTVSKDGTRIYVVNFNSSTISVINAQTGAVIGSPVPVGYFPISTTLNPAGTALYVSSSYLETVDIINPATNAVTSSFNVGRHPGAISFSPDGTRMYILNFTTGTLSAYNPVTNTPISSVSVGTRPMRMALSADGTRAYVLNNGDHTVSVIDTATMTAVGSPIATGRGDNFTDIAVTPDGSKVYVTNAQDNTVTVINTATRATSTVAVGTSPWGVSVSPDGSVVYVANAYSNNVSIISTATNTVVGTVQFSGTYVPVSVTFSPDGTKAYVTRVNYGSSTNGDVVVINTASSVAGV